MLYGTKENRPEVYCHSPPVNGSVSSIAQTSTLPGRPPVHFSLSAMCLKVRSELRVLDKRKAAGAGGKSRAG